MGARHRSRGQPCQDALRLIPHSGSGEEIQLVLVADGHGSCPNAEQGAALAVEAAQEVLQRFYQTLEPELSQTLRLNRVLELALNPMRRHLVQRWAQKVAEHAGEAVDALSGLPRPALLQAYGTTLLGVLIAPKLLLWIQLGDGDCLRVDADGQVSRPLPSDPSCFGDETPSLCLPEAWQSMRVAVQLRPEVETLLLLSTDGYSSSYAETADFEAIGPDYLTLLRQKGVETLRTLLPGFLERVTTAGSGDDVTLGLAWLLPARAEMPVPAPDQPAPAATFVPSEASEAETPFTRSTRPCPDM